MRRLLMTAALAVVLTNGPAGAFDAAGAFNAAGADIVGLRLGMSEADIVARLVHQGFKTDRGQDTIDSRTLDGHLHISMSPERGATEIIYVFDYGGDLVSTRLRDSIATRFGDPVLTDPMTWCLKSARDGSCPDDQAVLTYQPKTLTMILRAASAPR